MLLFHEALHPPSPFLSVSAHLSLSVVPHPIFLISGISLRFGDVCFLLASQSSLQLDTLTIQQTNPLTISTLLQ